MLKNFKIHLLLIFVLGLSVRAYSQDKVEYKDVILNGKPAKLNVATGEVIPVNTIRKLEEKEIKVDSTSRINNTVEANPTYHIVKEGETLLDISKKYNQPLILLKRVNDLETTLVDTGQKLLVNNFENAVLNHQEEKEKKELNDDDVNLNYHIVKKDETLYSLSKQYGLSLEELKNINNLKSNLIKVGQRLELKSDKVDLSSKNNSVWVVSKGDTLYSIAKKNGTSVEHIKQLNRLTSNLILVGQTLQIK